MKTIGVYIDGYKNVKDTQLFFSKSMAVLVANNNYGKTNLLNGVKDGLDFIFKNNKEAEEYIRNGKYRDIFDQKNIFTFEITFRMDYEKVYKYKYSIGYNDYLSNFGICEEELSYKSENNSEKKLLLKRNKSNPEEVDLYTIEGTIIDTYCAWENHSLLYLRAFSENNLQKKDDMARTGYSVTIKAIKEIYTIMTNGSTSKFCINEDTDLKDFSSITKKLENIKNESPNVYKKFTDSFINLFPQYKNVLISKLAETPYLVFIKNFTEIEETIDTLSFGTRRIIRLLYEIIIEKVPIAFIEELENGIQPKLLIDIVNNIYDIVNEPDSKTCLIITSHSRNFINLLAYNLESVHLGINIHLGDDTNSEESRFAKFARITKKGEKIIEDEMKRIQSPMGVGDFIYDYQDILEKAEMVQSWVLK